MTQGAVYTENFTQSLWDGNGRGYILVVPDETVKNQTVSHRAYAAMTFEPVAAADYQELTRQRDEKDTSIEGYDTIFSKAAEESENAAMCAVINFPLYYLALVLTMVAATILTLHQLSETNRYHRQFLLLRSLGMEDREMRSTGCRCYGWTGASRGYISVGARSVFSHLPDLYFGRLYQLETQCAPRITALSDRYPKEGLGFFLPIPHTNPHRNKFCAGFPLSFMVPVVPTFPKNIYKAAWSYKTIRRYNAFQVRKMYFGLFLYPCKVFRLKKVEQ